MNRFSRVVLILLFATLADRSLATEVCVDSTPDGLDAWVDQVYLGRTPVWVTIPEGSASLRLVEPSGSLYHAPAVDTLLRIADRDTLRLMFRVGRPVSLLSEPFGLSVLRDGERIGKTPIDLYLDSRRAARYQLLTPSGPVVVPNDSLLARGSWTWRGDILRIPSSTRIPRPLWRRLGRYVLPGLAAALGVGGLLAEEGADRAYRRYGQAIDPQQIEEHYDDARRRDAWAAALWIGAEVSLATALLAWILPEKSPTPGEERDQ